MKRGEPKLSGLLAAALMLGAPAVIAAPAAATVAPAPGQEGYDVGQLNQLSLEDLLNVQVVSATKTSQSLSEAPANIVVIQGSELRTWGYTSLADALSHVLGFFVVDDQSLPNVSVRGVSGGLRSESGLIKVMIDGNSVSYRTSSGNWLGEALVPLTSIDRVEIIRGPASALYGADAFLGVVNVITLSTPKNVGGEGSLSGNYVGHSFGGDADVTVAGTAGPVELMASARIHQEDRAGLLLPATSPAPSLPTYSKATDPATAGLQRSGVALLRVGHHESDSRYVNLTGYISGLDETTDFAEWAVLVRRVQNGMETDVTRLSRAQGGALLNSRYSLTDKVALSLDGTFLVGGRTPNERIEVGSPSFYIRPNSSYRALNLQAGADFKLHERFSLRAGLELVYDDELLPTGALVLKVPVGTQAAGSSIALSRSGPARAQLVNPGALLQATGILLPTKLTATGGIRYDYHNIYGSQVSGRFALVGTPRTDLNIKLMYGSAFKAPSPELLYAIPFTSGDVVGNLALKPQFVHTVEGLVTYTPLTWLSASTDLSYSYLINQAEFIPVGFNTVAKNLGRSGILSSETQLEASFRDYLRGSVGFEYVYARRDPGLSGYEERLLGEVDSSYPPLQLKAGVLGRLRRYHLQATVQARLVALQGASAFNTLANGGLYNLSPYVVLDVTVATVDVKLWGNDFTAEVLAKNILDQHASVPGYAGIDFPLNPRSILLQFRKRF